MLKHLLEGIEGIEFVEDKDLSSLSTFRLRAKGDLIYAHSIEAVELLVPVLKKNRIPYHILGRGANQVLPEKNSSVFVKLKFPFNQEEYLKVPRNEYHLPASVSLGLLWAHGARFGLKGWEVFTGIPATLGGAIFMNAGTEAGEIGNLVKEVTLINGDGKRRTVPITNDSFSYRKNYFVAPGDIIVAATLIHNGLDKNVGKRIKDYLHKRNETQPVDKATCGCVFKNVSTTCRAGTCVDIIGLKGLRFKDLVISEKHANFLENLGESSTANDVKEFVDLVALELELNLGITFEKEVKLEL